MSHTMKNFLCYLAYLSGGVVLTIMGPELWNVHPLVASVAASATTLCFLAVHMIVDTRHIARQAIEQTHRRRRELIALGKYVARIEQRIAEREPIAAGAPAEPQAPEEIATPKAAEASPTDVERNLLRFAARFGAAYPEEVSTEADDGSDTALQGIVAEAVTNSRVELYLQPVVRLPGRQTVHYEALSRIRDRWGNPIAADRFLPAAIAAGVAAELDTQQLASTISLCNRIGDRHPGTRLFCNLSAHALKSDSFRSELLTFMETHAELAGRLVFEMHTKTALALNAEAVADVRALESLGFAFSVDDTTLADLGRVYSVFSRLAYAKVDAAQLMEADPNVISALSRSATQLIAVRVETERQAAEMSALGIGFGQGFLFGEARPAKMGSAQQLRRAA